MSIDEDAIEELAKAPKRTTGDEGTVEERDIQDLIDADRYVAAKKATKPPFGLRLAQIRKPGTP